MAHSKVASRPVQNNHPQSKWNISYTPSCVARMVGFSLFTSAHIQHETQETIQRLHAMANAKLSPSPTVLAYFGLIQEGSGYTWNIN